MKYRTAISELLKIIDDRQWHSLYEAHSRFRLSPIEIYEAVIALQKIGIVERQDTKYRIQENLDEKKLSIMNQLYKSTRPSQLKNYNPKY
ncbi:MAG: hypothetical protein WBF69_04600 [Castellaniella sp.]|uniref:hypothetical protein n=1 Tax=Castellaniella sp. TaxID=1955812 RepID=UPI003C740CE2